MKITRVAPPKFRVGRYVLNEYELRTLTLEVAQGIKPSGIKVKDSFGNVAIILPNGCFSNSLKGMEISATLQIDLMQLNYKRKGE